MAAHARCLPSLLAIAILCCSAISCQLDSFGLRPLQRRKQLDGPLDEPIRRPELAAIMLKQSLYTKDFQVRCIAYAHLFKMIRLTRNAPQNGRAPVYRDAIDSLAIAADVDRATYFKLLKLHQTNITPKLFEQAIAALESEQQQDFIARQTCTELVECAAAYLGADMAEFLQHERRVGIVSQLERRKQSLLPADQTHWELGSSRAPVDRLRAKFEASKAQFTDEEDVRRARAKVESYDDYEAWQMRAQPSGPDPRTLHDSLSGQEEQADKVRVKLDWMLFRRKRLDFSAKCLAGKVPTGAKLDIVTAFEFTDAWRNLEAAWLAPKLGLELRQAIESFLTNPDNIKTKKMFERASQDYTALSQKLDELSLLNGELARNANSMGQLNEKYNQILNMLDNFDPKFDVAGVYQAVKSLVENEQRRNNVLNHFIETASW